MAATSRKRAREEAEEDRTSSIGWNAPLPERVERIASHFQSGSDHVEADDGASVCGRPFAACRLRGLFDEGVLEAARGAILENAEFVPKSNDLYKFHQSKHDFSSTQSAPLVRLRDIIYSDGFRGMMSRIVGVELSDHVDLSAARYAHSDYLLCHDDQLDGRRVAFIVYLVSRTWSKEDGGALDLFDVDEHQQPRDVITSLLPEWNSFVFFEVSAKSYHQVAEVLCKTPGRERVSISGWFHASSRIPAGPRWLEPPPAHAAFTDHAATLSEWIAPVYLNKASIEKIRASFIDDSTVLLRDFLTPAAHATLRAALQAGDYAQVGPWNRRHLHRYAGALPLFDMLTSRVFGAHMSALTGLDMVTCSAPRALRYGGGDYSLMHDDAVEPPATDFVYFVDAPREVDEETGGQLVYVAGEETLLTVTPTPNTLFVVMRDAGVMRFHKYRSRDAEGATLLVAMECAEAQTD